MATTETLRATNEAGEVVPPSETAERINQVFLMIQGLDITPTAQNVSILGSAHALLKQVYGEHETMRLQLEAYMARVQQMETQIHELGEELRAAAEQENEPEEIDEVPQDDLFGENAFKEIPRDPEANEMEPEEAPPENEIEKE